MSSGPEPPAAGIGAGTGFELGQPGGAYAGWRGFSLAVGRALPWSLASSQLSRRAAHRRIMRLAGGRATRG